MPTDKPIHIDLQAVIDERLRHRAKFVPRCLVNWLEGVICQERLNDMLRINYPHTGSEFCLGVLEHLNINLDIRHKERLPQNRRVIIVSNHPLGGLDGMALIVVITRHFGKRVQFIVNDLLTAIEPLQSVFLPINKHGAQSRTSISAIDNAMAGNDPIIIFPAGLCSRRGRDGKIRDLNWQKMFVTKAREFKRDIVPIHFGGQNSDLFYRFASWRKRLGLKFNIEMLRLPREVFNAEGKTFTITCGDVIPHTSLGNNAIVEAERIKEYVYNLASNPY